MTEYDLVVLGAGPGGYIAAIRAAQLGARTALVEEELVGGTCLNWGCIPTKSLIRSGRVAALMRHAADYGVTCSDVTIDYAAMNARKDKVVSILRGGVEHLLKARKIDLIRGRGRLASAGSVAVDLAAGQNRVIPARNIVVATGSEPAKPPVFPFDGRRVLTSDQAVAKTSIGASVLIIGGGFIGCEYASLYANLGLEVTVVELLDSILSTMDEAVIKEVSRGFKKRKIKVRTGTVVERLETTDSGVRGTLAGGEELVADFALVSVGRRPVTAGIGLEEVGVAMEKGYVVVDDRCRTSVASIYAIGDITGKLQLAHVASEQGVIAAQNIMGHDCRMDYSAVPSCVFTDPEAAAVGLTEREVKDSGVEYRVGRFPFRGLGKAHADGEIEGIVKAIAEAKTGRILGVHIIGNGASEMIAEAALAMRSGFTVEEVTRVIHAHPTLPEAVKEALEDVEGRSVHQSVA